MKLVQLQAGGSTSLEEIVRIVAQSKKPPLPTKPNEILVHANERSNFVKVDQVLIQQSAGHPDWDMEAADAVKQRLFEPARMGEQPAAVWVLRR
jgi:hypothetical protein